MINTKDITVSHVDLKQDEYDRCFSLARKTFNTWQSNRSFDSKLNDTIMGKKSEKALFEYLRSISRSLYIVDYDDVRNDNFDNHAPVDFIIGTSKKSLDNVCELLAKKSTSYNSSTFTQEERKYINQNKVFLSEIKSTRITNRLKTNGAVDYDRILNDDFLEYPNYLRKSSTISCFQDYLNYCIQDNLISNECTINDLKNIEKKNMSHLYFRVYFDEETSQAHLIGGINRNNFIHKSVIKKMQQKNKSEKALYLSTSLRNGSSNNKIIRTIEKHLNNSFSPK